MDIHGAMNFRGNPVSNFAFKMENDWPIDPQPGRVLFREQDRMLYICAELAGGLPVWVPCAQVKDMYRHQQGDAALEWTVEHKLNINPVLVQVYDAEGKWVIPDEIICSDPNRSIVKFNIPTAGTAICIRGEMFGVTSENVAYEQDFTEAADEWVVVHSLGYNPDIKVYVGGVQVQPQSIVHNSTTQATVTFSEPQSGFVRCF